jgi:hypothetical protein
MPESTWNLARLQLYFTQDDIDEILKIQPSRRNDDDFIAWFPKNVECSRSKVHIAWVYTV